MGQPIKAHRIWRPVNRSNRETTFKPSDFLVKTPVTGPTGSVNRSVYRSEPVTHVLLNLDLNSTGFRSNRSDKPLPEGGGLTGPVGFVNPGQKNANLQHNLAHFELTGICSFSRIWAVHDDFTLLFYATVNGMACY